MMSSTTTKAAKTACATGGESTARRLRKTKMIISGKRNLGMAASGCLIEENAGSDSQSQRSTVETDTSESQPLHRRTSLYLKTTLALAIDRLLKRSFYAVLHYDLINTVILTVHGYCREVPLTNRGHIECRMWFL